MNSYFGKALRWLLFLPITSLSMLLSGYIANIFLYSLNLFDPLPYSTMSMIFNSAIKGLFPGIVFVYVGGYIVPNFKRTVSIILAIIVVIFSVLSLIISGKDAYIDDGIFGVVSDWRNIINIVCYTLGAIFGYILISED